MVNYHDGVDIKTRLAVPETVTATMYREAGIDRDSGLDTSVVAHEWGHFISNRLIGNASGLGTTQGRAIGEGWADFHALLNAKTWLAAYAQVFFSLSLGPLGWLIISDVNPLRVRGIGASVGSR